jgi:heme a synthase
MPALARFAWSVLAWNVAVIAWGAYVRATGSGAGCGDHWPLCNGTVVPRAPETATLIEYSHRLTSGVALLAVLALLVWTLRACRPGHPARRGAAVSLVLILMEAGIGAGLVLFQLVADNASMARAMFMAAHLSNTFFLLAALALTAWWLSGHPPLSPRTRKPAAVAALGTCAALLLAGASGAVAALGDTLFPSGTLREALQADLSATSHALIRLRVLHPILAAGAGLAVLFATRGLARAGGRFAARAAAALPALVAGQIALGLLNVALLAPVWLQLVHLLVADAIWILFVLQAADALAASPQAHAAQAAA